MHKSTSLPSLCLRIDLAMDRRIGQGKIQLLEAIEACGSISAAGRAMDMSYKLLGIWSGRSIASAAAKLWNSELAARVAAERCLPRSALLWFRTIEKSSVLRHEPSSKIF